MLMDDQPSSRDDASRPARRRGDSETARPATSGTCRRRWLAALAGLPLLAALAVWFAPAIVARTRLPEQIAARALGLNGKVTVGSASLGWFSPVILRDARLLHPDGSVLAEIPQVTSRRTLLSLLLNQSDVGVFHLERPRATLVLRDEGSNAEDVFAPWWQWESDAAAAPFGCGVELDEGQVEIVDPASGARWSLDAVEFTFDMPYDAAHPITARGSGRLGPRGGVKAELRWSSTGAEGTWGLGAGDVHVDAREAPLDLIAAALARFLPDVSLAGLADADLTCQWRDAQSPTASVRGTLRAVDLDAAAPNWLGDDRLRLEFAAAEGAVAYQNGRLEVQQLALHSPVAEARLRGGAAMGDLAETSLLAWLAAALRSEDYEVEGRADVARLARLLPGTLRVREDTELTDGLLVATLHSREEEGRRRYRGRLESANLRGVTAGRPVVWERPVLVTFSASQLADQLAVDDLSCHADFLTLTASGAWNKGRFTAEGDLDRLAEQLSQFFDLGAAELAGMIKADFDYRRDDRGRLRALGDVLVENLRLTLPGARPWAEPRLAAKLTVEGTAAAEGIARIDSAAATILAGDDRLEIETTAAVDRPTFASAAPVEVRLAGELARWLPRVQVFLPLPGWQIRGGAALTARGVASLAAVEIESADVEVTELAVAGEGWNVYEPIVRAELSGRYDLAEQRFESKLLTVAGTAVALRGDNIAVAWGEAPLPQAAGSLAFRGDLAQIGRWLSDPGQAEQQFAGALTGRAELAVRDGATQAQWQAEIADFTLLTRKDTPGGQHGFNWQAATTPQWQTAFFERQVTLAGDAQYDPQADAVALRQFVIAADSLRAAASGTIAQPLTRCDVDIAGSLEYDLPRLLERGRAYVGPHVTLTGRDQRPFRIRGPLMPPAPSGGGSARPAASTLGVRATVGEAALPRPGAAVLPAAAVESRPDAASWISDELTAQAAVGWHSAHLYGVALGPADVAAELKQGVVHVGPLDIPVLQGRITAAPRILLRSTPVLLVLDRGPVAQDLQITQEMCHTWMKYVAPLLADATRVDGRFSLALEGARVPLADPDRADAAGVLAIHGAQVRPGPLADQMIWIAQQVQALLEKRPLPDRYIAPQSPLLELRPQEVGFRLVDGQVYHQGLQMNVREIVVRTSGTVALDQTMSLVAEVPIRDEWVRGDRFLASLGGQTLQVPVRGKLSQPQVDSRVLADTARRVLGGAAERMLEEQLNRQLERLLPWGNR